MSPIRSAIVTIAAVVLPAPALLAQGVAFQPVVGSLPSGPVLNTTPAVSLDRRYVRLGINAQFIDNAAFNTFVVPGAVSGGPSGPGALGGVGLGGAGGGGGAGVGGGQFLAGMNGVIDPTVGYDPYGLAAGTALPFYPTADGMPGWGFGPMPDQTQASRPAPSRSTARTTVKRGRNPRDKAKPPTTAAPPAAPAPSTTKDKGRAAR